MRAFIAAGVATALVAVLGGCGNTSKVLGLDKQAPDEFAVVTRAPLSLPPEYNLKPPRPGAARPQEGTTRDQARRVVTGAAAQADAVRQALPADTTEGERALLQKAGTDQAVTNIRQIVDEETSALARESESFTDALLFWREPESYGTVVDAAAESRRLRATQALGQPVTTGASPTIERRERGILEGIF